MEYRCSDANVKPACDPGSVEMFSTNLFYYFSPPIPTSLSVKNSSLLSRGKGSMAICPPSSESSSATSGRAWVVHALVTGAAVVAAAGAHAAVYFKWFRKDRSRVVGIIPFPGRFASSRFEGKPLVWILGKLMIQV